MWKTKTLIGLGAGVAAIAAAAPASAQYYSQSYAQPYGYSQSYAQPYARSYGYQQPYSYGQSYGYQQQYGYAQNTSVATQQCTAAVQSRLYNRTSLGSILGSLVGIPANSSGQVLSITQASPRGDGTVRVRGLASSGRMSSNGYGQYGVGAYGSLGYGYANAADLSFRCDVGPNGSVYDVSIRRR
jgi:hypothetical protein